MKITRSLMWACVVIMVLTGFAWSATEQVISVTASIPDASPSMSITILRLPNGNPTNNPWINSTQVQWMDFGTLTYLMNGKSAGFFYSPTSFCVVVFTDPMGKPYEIKSSCQGLSSAGGGKIPDNSFAVAPVYSRDDLWIYTGGSTKQGDLPAEARLGTPSSAVQDNKLIYSSESGNATARILQVYYSLPPYGTGGSSPFGGFAPIPLSQKPDTYSGTITLTMSVK
jgi:hypothetical protein